MKKKGGKKNMGAKIHLGSTIVGAAVGAAAGAAAVTLTDDKKRKQLAKAIDELRQRAEEVAKHPTVKKALEHPEVKKVTSGAKKRTQQHLN